MEEYADQYRNKESNQCKDCKLFHPDGEDFPNTGLCRKNPDYAYSKKKTDFCSDFKKRK